jgi:hypothetical protein
MITSTLWIPKGAAKAVPDTYDMNDEEFNRIKHIEDLQDVDPETLQQQYEKELNDMDQDDEVDGGVEGMENDVSEAIMEER